MINNSTKSEKNNLVPRPPIVVVMGHIDHGKTTLLDYIRKTAAPPGGEPRPVAGRESGGITQHIGAYQINYNGKIITFIDTPGHEAFSKMRSRGAKVADIAILVVAADDGIKPQTKESILTIKDAKIPFLVAINKIDKETADPEKVKNELAGEEIFLEGGGGIIPFSEISAKNGQGISNLLDTILILAELEDLKANPEKNAEGIVIESHLDKKRGITATILVKEGTLKKNQFVSAGGATTKIIIFEDFNGLPTESALPSDPVLVVGFDKIPQVGFEFKSFLSQNEALEHAQCFKQKTKITPSSAAKTEKELQDVGIVIKSDTAGSAEALVSEIQKLRRDFYELKILRAEAGEVSDDDIKLAGSSKNPLVVAFRVKVPISSKDFGEKIGVKVWNFDIIYDVYDFLKSKIEDILPPETVTKVLGNAKIIKIFPSSGKGQIVGGKVLEGFLEKGAKFFVLRRLNKIGEGKIENLQVGKTDTQKAETSSEFGAKIVSSVEVVTSDELEVLNTETIKRKL